MHHRWPLRIVAIAIFWLGGSTPCALAQALEPMVYKVKFPEPAKSYAEAKPLTLQEQQQYLFQSKCGACHTIGQGDKVGPDLAGVTGRRERAWLTRYIQAPDEVLAAGDPVATGLFKKYKEVRMPNLGLTQDEVTDLLWYLQTQSAAHEKARKHSGNAHH